MEFIYECDNFLSEGTCKELIVEFERKKSFHKRGETATGGIATIKSSTDLQLSFLPDVSNVVDTVSKKIREIVPRYLSFLDDERFRSLFDEYAIMFPQIQKSNPSDFYRWHFDSFIQRNSRLLAYIIYLNDVEEGVGGTTDFLCGKSVKPKTGKLLVFPATWTYIHRGKRLEKGTKYIMVSFVWSEIPSPGS